MSAPAVPIDSDLVEGSADVFYVIEQKSIWKTSNLSEAGAATWTEVWIEGALLQGTLGGLLRVRCAPGSSTIVYVLGWGDKDGTYYPFILRSESAGTTWSEHWIDEAVTARDYTVTENSVTLTSRVGEWYTSGWVKIQRVGDDVAGTYNPWGIAYQVDNAMVNMDPRDLGSTPGHPGEGNSIQTWYSDSALGVIHGSANDQLASAEHTIAEGWMTEYLGAWTQPPGVHQDTPKAANREYLIGMTYETPAAPTQTGTITFWVFWNKPSPIMPKAIDVARSNNNWVYVGLQDKIMKSEDGGYTWAALSEDFGAYDICVDPQAAGVIYFCSEAGSVRCMVAGVDQGELNSETATDVPLRLARDLNTGKLWLLKSGTSLTMRESGSWTEQKASIAAARGLHAYLGGKLIFVEAADIYISDDYGATVTAKKGGWSEYASGVNAHRIVVAE